jgi:hypothetical protein
MSDKILKDSGRRQEFDTGAVRDCEQGKGRFDLLPGHAIGLLAKHFEAGATKYGDRNWEKGIPLHRYLDSATRHLMKFVGGERDEPHLVAAMWNIACLLQTRHWIETGRLPQELNDLPVGFEDDPYNPQPEKGSPTLAEARDLLLLSDEMSRVQELRFTREPLRIRFDRMTSAAASDYRRQEMIRLVWNSVKFPASYVSKDYRVVYIAGPMRGYAKFNFPAFDQARDEWLSRGWVVISPADIDRAGGLDETTESVEFSQEANREFVRRDTFVLKELLRPEHGDCIAVLPGWERSTGAKGEVFLAAWLGLDIRLAKDPAFLLDTGKLGGILGSTLDLFRFEGAEG